MNLPEKPEFRCRKYLRNCFCGLASIIFISIVACFILDHIQQDKRTDTGRDFEYLVVGVILLIVFLVSGLFRYIQENNDFLVAWAFMDLMPMYCTVLRDGRKQIIRSEDVVVGDILMIMYGERIAADVRVFVSHDLEVNNVALTGYSTSVIIIPNISHPNKWISRNVGFACSHVTKGSGRGLVIACGVDSEVGIMARLSMEPRPLTRPRKHMQQVSNVSLAFAIPIPVSVFLQVSFYRYTLCAIMCLAFFLSLRMEGPPAPILLDFYVSFTICSSPVYLPTLIFFGLWHTKRQLLKIGCYARNMEAVSTLGLTTVICSNLIGSMTQRAWRVSELLVDGEMLNVQKDFVATNHFFDLIRASILCNHAYVTPGQRGLPKSEHNFDGTDYDKALLKFGSQFVASIEMLRVQFKRLASKSFDAITHLQVSVHSTENVDGETEYHLFIRGHLTEVMDHCSTCYMKADEPKKLIRSVRNSVVKKGSMMDQLGRHTYGFASKVLTADDYMLSLISNGFSYSKKNTYNTFMQTYSYSMCFLGLIAANNPPYPNIISAVDQCRNAGIKLVLLTRADVSFSRAVAKSVGVIGELNETAEDVAKRLRIPITRVERRMITAVTVNMHTMSKQPHHQRWDIEQLLLAHVDVVFNRIAVSQRHLIIDVCLKLGAVVTAIGSSVHDTSAIRCANVGVSESASSNVSQSCADLIVLENNFVTLVKAIAKSRLLFENMKKAVVYALSSNMAHLMIHLFFIVLKMPFRMFLLPSIFIAFFVNLVRSCF